MKNKKHFLRVLFLMIALMLISACSKPEAVSSRDLIQKFKENIKTINSADVTLSAEMQGEDSGDEVDFDLSVSAKIDRNDKTMPKADLKIQAQGKLEAGSDAFEGRLNMQVRTIGQQFYFNLEDIDATDPSFAQFKPLITAYQNKWQTLGKDFIPEDIRQLQSQDAETLKKEEEIKDLFINTRLIDIAKDYGMEKVGGRDVYHVAIKMNEKGLREYIAGVSEISGQQMTQAEIDEAVSFLEAVESIDVWISPKDFYPYKVAIELSGEDLDQEVSSDVSITYLVNEYNETYDIQAPADAQEFNPLALLMGMQMGAGALPPLDEVSIEE